jgi:hypothetical protein
MCATLHDSRAAGACRVIPQTCTRGWHCRRNSGCHHARRSPRGHRDRLQAGAAAARAIRPRHAEPTDPMALARWGRRARDRLWAAARSRRSDAPAPTVIERADGAAVARSVKGVELADVRKAALVVFAADRCAILRDIALPATVDEDGFQLSRNIGPPPYATAYSCRPAWSRSRSSAPNRVVVEHGKDLCRSSGSARNKRSSIRDLSPKTELKSALHREPFLYLAAQQHVAAHFPTESVVLALKWKPAKCNCYHRLPARRRGQVWSICI